MKRGYIRISKTGPSPDDQRRALNEAGVAAFGETDAVYLDILPKRKPKEGEDALPERTIAIRSLRAGDELVVANAGRLGTSRADILRVLGEIGRRGASVFDAAAGRSFACVPEIADAAAFADLAEGLLVRERAAHGRKAMKDFGTKSGPRPKLRKDDMEAIHAMWSNPQVRREDVETAAGVKTRTLYRMLGPRGTPIFGTTPQKPKRRR